MKKLAFISVFAVLLLSSCSKEIGIPVLPETPVFFVSGTVDGEAYSYTAGSDGIYHFTGYSREDNGQQEQSGRFSIQDCAMSNCANSIQFIFKRNSNSNILFQSSNIAYKYADSANVISGIVFPISVVPTQDTLYSNVTVTVLEYIGGSPTNTIASSKNNLPLQANINKEDKVNIGIGAVQRSNGVKYASRMDYFPSAPDSCKPVQIRADITGGKVILQAITTQAQAAFIWHNGATSSELSRDYVPGASYAVTVSSAIDEACSSVASINNLPDIVQNTTLLTPAFDIKHFPAVEQRNAEGVEIRWYDDMGVLYSSTNALQTDSTYFTITNISDYLPNEAGTPTVKMDVEYRCIIKELANTSGFPINIVLKGQGVIAVGKE
jgi:hypothetical protein